MQKENPCRNFAPNIFNKNKCQNCFKPRETHLLSDKDLSKAKPIYCGWLLLAPIGTDFDNPVHKSRKWQRRWFVLFEHGALRYALDDNANTLPQGTINMNSCSDVAHAEPMTGQKHSLCIFLPEMKYFIRGENREDTLGWYDALIVYPETAKEDARIKKKLMKKRKSEVPSHVRASPVASKVPAITSFSAPNTPLSKHDQPIPQSQKAKPPSNLPELLQRSRPSSTSSLGYRSPTSPLVNREWGSLRGSPGIQRHSSLSSTTVRPSDLVRAMTQTTPYVDLGSPVREVAKSPTPAIADPIQSKDEKMETNDVASHAAKTEPSYFSIDRKGAESKGDASETRRQHTSDSISSVDSSVSSHGGPESAEDRKKHLKEQQSDISRIRKSSERQHDVERKLRGRSPGREEVYRLFGRERRRSRVIEAFMDVQADQSNKENNDPGLSDGSVSPRFTPSTSGDAASTDAATNATSTTSRDDARGRSIARRSTYMKQGTQTPDASTSSSSMILRRAKSLDRKAYESITISPDLLNLKKGWLTKRQDGDKEVWTKHWFVLADQTLKYYKDSVAEDYSETDGEINLKNCENVTEIDVQQNYGFRIYTQDGYHTLSAMTNGIRRNWINAILKATKPAHNPPDLTHTSDRVASKREEKTEKKDEPEIEKTSVEDLSVTERAQRRRARIRDRRKQGRSRTYDFAEFKPLVSSMSKEREEKTETKTEAPSPDSETEIRTRHRSGSSRRTPVLQRTVSSKSLENQWQKVERLHIPLPQSKTNHHLDGHDSPASTQESSSVVKTLQAEVDSLKQQMEKNQMERLKMFDDNFFNHVENGNHDNQHSDDPVVLRRQLEQQRLQIDNLKEELNSSTDKAREKEKELRECSMQLDISLSEVQLFESQLSKAQNEAQMEKKKREEAEKDYERRTKAQVHQIEESEVRLKESESRLLDAQQKIRELDRQANLQKDHKKEVENLHEQIKMLQRQTEDQEEEMAQLQESYEARCQDQKQLEDSLGSAKEMIESYEEQISALVGNKRSSDKDDDVEKIRLKLNVEKLNKELKESKVKEENLKIQCAKFEAQIQINNDCNQTLQEELEDANKQIKTMKESLSVREKEIKTGRQEIKNLKSNVEKLEASLKSQNEEKSKLMQNLQKECAQLLEANKKLKEELNTEHSTRLQETNQLNAKLKDVSMKLDIAEKQISEIEDVQAKSKSKKGVGSFKARVTELEAEMDNTGQMLAARLTALENPKRKENMTDDSDEGGSSSSTSSLNELRRKNKEEEKIRSLQTQLQKTENELEATHLKLAEIMSALQEARSITSDKDANDNSSPDVQRILQGNQKTIGALEKDIAEYDKKCVTVRDCLKELHNKVVEVQKEAQKEKAKHVLPFLESVLVDTLQMLGGAPSPRASKPPSSPVPANKSGTERDSENSASAKLRMLTERLKATGGSLSPLTSPKLSRSQSPSSPLSPPGLRSPTSKAVKRPTELEMHPERKLSKEDRVKMFAEQLGIQAMVITEMAASLERYQAEKACDPSSPLYAKISEGLQELSSNDLKSDSNSNLLRHSDTLAEKLLLKSHFMRELAKLRDSHMSRIKSSDSRMRSKSEASSHKSTSKYGTAGGKNSQHPSDLEQAAGLSVTHAHIGYILQVYNERIARLSRDAKESQHQADAFQRKLKDLVDACKTQDVDKLSKLAVEVDTGVTPAQKLDELPPWKQQVDYGTLHGAQASLSSLNLQLEASFFSELARDVSCMSTNIHHLVDLGTRIIELDGSLSKFLKPSEIGEHASTIAYEAISQAEHVFLCQRIRKDYEEELTKMKTSVKQQSLHCEVLQSKLKEIEEGGVERMQELNKEHKQKVEHLTHELASMSSDMNANLTRFAQKQQKEMEACIAKHEQETDILQRDLKNTKAQLQQTAQDYVNEVEKLKKSLTEIKKKHDKQSEETRTRYERMLEEVKKESDDKVSATMKEMAGKERKTKDHHKKELDIIKKQFENEISEMERRRKQEVENLEIMHETDLETLNTEKINALERVTKEWKAKVNSEKKNLQNIMEREREENAKQLSDLEETTVTFGEMNKKIEEVKQEYEEMMLTRENLHEENLKMERESLAQKIREQVEEEMKMNNSIPFADDSISLASMTSVEGESKDALKSRILALEEEIEEMGQLSYQVQLDEIKRLCDQSFAESEETHVKQLNELSRLHKLEIMRMKEEKEREMEDDTTAMKMAIESLRKHHQDELQQLESQRSSLGIDKEGYREIERLKSQMETLSEHYSSKCVELAKIESKLEEAEEKLSAVDVSNRLLKERNDELAKKLESELDKLKSRSKYESGTKGNQESAGDVYQLQVKLRVKNSGIALLKQEVEALKQQLETAVQDKKYSQQRHKSLFDEMTSVKSREAKSKRDIARMKEKIARLESNGDNSDFKSDSPDYDAPKSAGYDFMKSKSHPDFPSIQDSSTKTNSASVKRRSSDRSSRSKSLKEGHRS